MKVLVAGAGKMARNVGFFLLRRGADVVWADRERDWLDALERRIGKDVRRLAFVDEEATTGEASFLLSDDDALPACDCLIETIEEDLDAKRAIIEALRGRVVEGGPLLTNSSSILPGEIGAGVAGAHFFYPVDMTGFVEAVFDEATDDDDRRRTLGFLNSLGLDVIEQGPENAFAANRIFLPVQNECFRAIMSGVSATDVDEASVNEYLPAGTLSMMDSIGLDTIHAAVGRYLSRMPDVEAGSFAPLFDGLGQLVKMGKHGTKNRDGILRGAALPWALEDTPHLDPGFGDGIAALFRKTCLEFMESGRIDRPSLRLVLDGLLGVTPRWVEET